MKRVRFVKMHGLGNDYVYVDGFSQVLENPGELARRWSPRRTGIGSDGLILILPSREADCRMEIYNADGSRAEMCGNGIRCVAKYVYESGIAKKNPLRVETDAGEKIVWLEVDEAGRVRRATVDMGSPILEGPRIPVRAEGRVVGYPLEVDGERVRVTCVSMGNPHCVVFVESPERLESLDLATVGPRFEHHPFFPNRVNTEFVHVEGPGRLVARVWERGSGETMACGTGACAAAVAAALEGRGARKATVALRGGELEIDWREGDGHVYMTGPATEVFRGEIEVDG
ncbi:MAG: diaminopimelate epimerase [Candidatus Binatia bacterium]|nr:MAG: diaminopimelate epimerase [Candidatus Binatia bacterium]